jgi:hypothetical protein
MAPLSPSPARIRPGLSADKQSLTGTSLRDVEPQASTQVPRRLIRNKLDLGGIEPLNVIDGREEDGLLVANQGRDTRHFQPQAGGRWSHRPNRPLLITDDDTLSDGVGGSVCLALRRNGVARNCLLLPHESLSRSSHDERTGAYQAGGHATA